MPAEVRLADIAPNLARARDQWVAGARELRAEWRRCMETLAHKEHLVAHRDLQAVRAMATGSGRYLRVRQAKLEQARRELREATAALADVVRRRIEWGDPAPPLQG